MDQPDSYLNYLPFFIVFTGIASTTGTHMYIGVKGRVVGSHKVVDKSSIITEDSQMTSAHKVAA